MIIPLKEFLGNLNKDKKNNVKEDKAQENIVKENKVTVEEIKVNRVVKHVNNDFIIRTRKYQKEYDINKRFSLVINCYFSLVFDDDADTTAKTVDMINEKLNKATNKDLNRYDKMFRDTTSMNWWYDWRSKEIDFLEDIAWDENDLINLLGISTFHPNGYFREKALRRLIKIDNPRVIPFVIIRLNDWVKIVQMVAKTYLDNLMTKENILEYMPYFDLLKHTEYYSRLENNEILSRVEEILKDKEVLEKLIPNIYKYNEFTKLYIYKSIKDCGFYGDDYIFELLLKEKSAYIQNKILYDMVQEVDDSFFEKNLEKLKKCKANKVKQITIIRYYNQMGIKSMEELQWALVDKSLAVRDLGRIFLKKAGFDEFRDFYQNRIDNEICVIGLCEVATLEDYSLLYDKLYKHNISTSKTITKTLAKLDYTAFEEELYRNLQGDKLGLSKTAKEILVENFTKVDEEKVYEIYKNTDVDYIRKNTVILLMSLSKWKRISYILEFLSIEDEELSAIVNSEKLCWFGSFNRSYTKPTEADLRKLKKALENQDAKLSKYEKLELEQLMKTYF